MKRSILTFIVSMFLYAMHAQGSITFSDKPFVLSVEKDSAINNDLERTPAFSALTPEEKDVVYWINFVRKSPAVFLERVLQPFLQQFPETKSTYSRSLMSELKSATALNSLVPSEKLNKTAKGHAGDLGSKGLEISHTSSAGLSFQQRMNAAGFTQCVAENIYEGRQSALECVIFLLIDHGVKNLGHRKNILDANAKSIGAAFYPIKDKATMYFLVQDFSCE